MGTETGYILYWGLMFRWYWFVFLYVGNPVVNSLLPIYCGSIRIIVQTCAGDTFQRLDGHHSNHGIIAVKLLDEARGCCGIVGLACLMNGVEFGCGVR